MYFSKDLFACSSASPKVLAFGSYSLVNFQPILVYFVPNFKLKYGDSENMKAGCVSTVVFNLHQIKHFWGHPVEPRVLEKIICLVVDTFT